MRREDGDSKSINFHQSISWFRLLEASFVVFHICNWNSILVANKNTLKLQVFFLKKFIFDNLIVTMWINI